jgi:hypothetical protein
MQPGCPTFAFRFKETLHHAIPDNARNGCKLEKGPISLQGHDPTTDLSFRNIRIAELPKKTSASQPKGGK